MKNKFLKLTLVAVIALAAGWNISQNEKGVKLSDVASVNVEALAGGESNPMCPNGCFSDGSGCFCHTWYPSYREA